jgi:hypothetical protein
MKRRDFFIGGIAAALSAVFYPQIQQINKKVIEYIPWDKIEKVLEEYGFDRTYSGEETRYFKYCSTELSNLKIIYFDFIRLPSSGEKRTCIRFKILSDWPNQVDMDRFLLDQENWETELRELLSNAQA